MRQRREEVVARVGAARDEGDFFDGGALCGGEGEGEEALDDFEEHVDVAALVGRGGVSWGREDGGGGGKWAEGEMERGMGRRGGGNGGGEQVTLCVTVCAAARKILCSTGGEPQLTRTLRIGGATRGGWGGAAYVRGRSVEMRERMVGRIVNRMACLVK